MGGNLPLRYVYRGPEKTGLFVHAVSQGDAESLLTVAPGNIPPAEGGYVCFVLVHDYWRMSGTLARDQGFWHYATGIEREILEDVKKRRCAIVFDLCNEGPHYDSEIFDELFGWIERNHLPSGQIVWLAQNRSMEAQCRSKAGLRANLITFEYYDFFVKMMALLFAPGSSSKVVGLDSHAFTEQMFDPLRKDKMILCLNATPKMWRVLSVGALIHHGLMDNSLVSFPGASFAAGKFKGAGSPEVVRRYVDAKSSLSYLKQGVESAFHLDNLTVDDITVDRHALYSKIDYKIYERTFFSLVTETDFTDGVVTRITEKLVKPFCLGHPAIVVGNPNSIRFMTDLGFGDWNGVIDRTYESEPDPPARFNLLMNEVVRQVRDIRSDSDGWLQRVREIGGANIRHAMTGRFLSRYRELYDCPVVSRLSKTVAVHG